MRSRTIGQILIVVGLVVVPTVAIFSLKVPAVTQLYEPLLCTHGGHIVSDWSGSSVDLICTDAEAIHYSVINPVLWVMWSLLIGLIVVGALVASRDKSGDDTNEAQSI